MANPSKPQPTLAEQLENARARVIESPAGAGSTARKVMSDTFASIGPGSRRTWEEVSARVQQVFESLPEPDVDGWIARRLQQLSKRVTYRNLLQLVPRQQSVMEALHEIPRRMQKVTNQARLVLELIDDFIDGRYREIPWHALAIAVTTLLYSVSPADVVPDYVPVLGAIDDVIIVAIGMSLVRKHLKDYCDFKGYDVKEYF